MPNCRHTLIMGVLNVTPDSFSDGGRYTAVDAAIARGLEMADEGADILDIGGESTRPSTFRDAARLPSDEEMRRVLPVIQGLKAARPDMTLSIDTYKAEVAQAAVAAGVTIINDISALSFDPEMALLAESTGATVILMHMPGPPKELPENPRYGDVPADVRSYLTQRIDFALSAGISSDRIWLDPGIGFGKNTHQNLEILRRLPELKNLGFPLVVGTSRKRFLGEIMGADDPLERVEGTAATVALSIAGGADAVRVHDVRQMARVAKVADAIVHGWEP